MAPSGVNHESPLGFLTVVEDQKHGLFGGYLILNRAGRPLEFHCTAPVRPNRAQEILYGPTLRPYLYGEQIGRTLLEQGKHPAEVILTDCEPMLEVGEFVPAPVVLVGAQDTQTASVPLQQTPSDGRKWRIDGSQSPKPNLRSFVVGGQSLALRCEGTHDQSSVVQKLEATAMTLDLAEPFERIRAAIDEARRGGQ